MEGKCGSYSVIRSSDSFSAGLLVMDPECAKRQRTAEVSAFTVGDDGRFYRNWPGPFDLGIAAAETEGQTANQFPTLEVVLRVL